jgi:multiple sugar transport system substrate-binding protein
MCNTELMRILVTSCIAAAIVVATSGCPNGNRPQPVGKPTSQAKPQPLVLLVAEDPQLGAAIAQEWRGRTEEELTVRDVSLADLARASRLPGDAVIFPIGWLGQLVERELIRPLESEALEDPDFNQRDIFDHIRVREMRWGGRTMAAPLGSPQLLLCYRADIFEKLELKPPSDWKEYQAVIERLSDRAGLGDLGPSKGQSWRAAIEPLAEGWAGQLLLARAAAYALHREQVSPLFRFDTLEPVIAEAPYVRALEELVAAAEGSVPGDARMTPQEAFAALGRGESAMAIGWPSGQTAETEKPAVKIAFAPLPGSREAFRMATKTWEGRTDEIPHIPLLSVSGRLAAVTSSSADVSRATGFVTWLAGRDVSTQLAPHSSATTLFRTSQIATSGRWTPALSADSSKQYAETLAAALSAPRVFPGLNLPGREEYLAALDEAVQQALDGKRAQETLSEASERWREITERLGKEKQLRANRRSLGMEKL